MMWFNEYRILTDNLMENEGQRKESWYFFEDNLPRYREMINFRSAKRNIHISFTTPPNLIIPKPKVHPLNEENYVIPFYWGYVHSAVYIRYLVTVTLSHFQQFHYLWWRFGIFGDGYIITLSAVSLSLVTVWWRFFTNSTVTILYYINIGWS